MKKARREMMLSALGYTVGAALLCLGGWGVAQLLTVVINFLNL